MEPQKTGPSARFGLGAFVALAVAGLGLLAACGESKKPFDAGAYGRDLAASLAKACPMASPGDVAAHDGCRKRMGNGAEASWRGYAIQWGGEQPGKPMKDKKTTWFQGDLYQNLYLALFMFTGEHKVVEEADGAKTVVVQAYFRNGLPPGNYPYPFWHSAHKWEIYEQANEIRFHFAKDGKLKFVGRSEAGDYGKRGEYALVTPPAFTGQWTWTDAEGKEQPSVTLFSDVFSPDNPKLAEVDATYRKTAIALRNGDCVGCHSPTGHKVMNALTLLQTPQHAAGSIDEVISTVRDNKMPLDERKDPKALKPEVKDEILTNGAAFKKALQEASAWEKEQGRAKPVK